MGPGFPSGLIQTSKVMEYFVSREPLFGNSIKLFRLPLKRYAVPGWPSGPDTGYTPRNLAGRLALWVMSRPLDDTLSGYTATNLLHAVNKYKQPFVFVFPSFTKVIQMT